MEKALIFSSGENLDTLSLSFAKLQIETCIESSFELNSAVKAVKDNAFDLIVIDTPFSANVSQISEFKKKTDCDILVITDKNSAVEVSKNLSKLGIFVLSAPLENWQISLAVNFIKASNSRFDSLKKEKDGLKKKVEDMKIIDRAKCCLIHYLAISEATAHRHIEKQAMDMRCTKRKVAEEILKKYES